MKTINKKIYTLLYIVVLNLAWTMNPIHAHNIHLDATRLSAKDGLSCNTVKCVVQDRDGFIWFATPNGMSRYDGYQFKNYSNFDNDATPKNNSSISLLMTEDENGKIWGYSSKSILCCYDLETARFADYTHIDNSTKLLGSRFKSSNGMWLHASDIGVRYVTFSKGKLQTIDFTTQKGQVIGTRQHKFAEDDKHNIWIASDKGLNMITPNMRSILVLKNKNIKVLTCNGSTIAVLTDKGEALLYNSQGKLLKHSQLPSMMGIVGKSRASFFWQGEWYIFTEGDTYAMNLKTGAFHKPAIQIPNAMDKNSVKSYYFLYDKEGCAYIFAKKSRLFKKLKLLEDKNIINSRDKNFCAAEDAQGKVFITSYGSGLFVFDPKSQQTEHFSATDKNPLFHTDFLSNIFIDRSDCIWIATGDGVFCCKEQKELKADFVKIAPNEQNEWSNYVRYIKQISPDKLFIGTKNCNNYLYDLNSNQPTFLFRSEACVYAYAIDKMGRKWIGTKGDGLYINDIHYSKKDKKHFISDDNIYDIVFDKKDRVWIATWNKGLRVTSIKDGNVDGLKFDSLLNKNGREAHIHDLLLDRKGRLWASTNNGVAMIDTHTNHPDNKGILRYSEENGKLPASEIVCCMEAHDGTLWFGTNKGVLKCTFNPKTKELNYQLFNKENGLTNNTIRSLAEDKLGNIWIGTEEGLSRLTEKTLDICSFLLGSTIQENNFNENCALQLPDGRVAFGLVSSALFLTPTPASSLSSKLNKKAVITDMTINGVSIYDRENEGILSKALNYTQEISLPFDKNSLSIFYSNFDYPHIRNAIYQYYLEGIDKTWRPMTSINHADFSDLRPGHYTLHLRTLVSSNHWSEETQLSIIIRQPWYNTWFAWIIYLVLIGGIGFLFYRSWRRNFDLNQQMEMEKQMHDFRIEFFTHISHEFRTPLSIIQSAVEKITYKETGHVSKNTLLTLNRGTKRLLRLINQLMEFRKVNTGNMKLALEEGNIVLFVRNIYNDIRQVAVQKDVNMSFTPWVNNYKMYFDHDKVETIVYNLLSNAMKYTPDKGTVDVKLSLDGSNIQLTVEDNGPGIKPEREQDLFKPFMHGYVSKGGMGIGLYTAQQMATLHQGSLTYRRSTNLGGSLFTFTLPIDKDIYDAADFVTVKAIDENSMEKDDIDTIVKEMTPQAINDITIMVIEDDPDMMQQIKSELSVYFRVESFMNGKTGYENIKVVKPALLICDIMLPGMSGYEIVSNMKADPETQDIPVIMLTAFDDANHILKAYKNFVDDYMIKPCNFKLLIARALQFVAMDLKAKKGSTVEKKAEDVSSDKTKTKKQENDAKEGPTLLMSPLDKKFKDKFTAVVAQHISDSSFNIDRLAELLNLGRTTVYNRTKSIMGVSPNTYIQNERLRIAAEWLLEGEYTVSEISAKAGFSDATYFYKCFKNKYGVPPRKFGKQSVKDDK